MSRNETGWVQLVMMNDQGTYTAVCSIIADTCWWDDDDDTWNGIDAAAAKYRELVESIDPATPGFSDLDALDLNKVDWAELITDELYEANIAEGRPGISGLPS